VDEWCCASKRNDIAKLLIIQHKNEIERARAGPLFEEKIIENNFPANCA
jgi:hypothetical protein